MIRISKKFNNAGKIDQLCLDDRFLLINPKIDIKIIEELFLNYKIVNKMKGTGRKYLDYYNTIINIYKNKDNILY